LFGTFNARPGLALGVAQAGTAISGILIPILANSLLETTGWRMTFVGLALLPGLVTLPIAALVLRDTPMTRAAKTQLAQTGHTPAEAMRNYRFWIISVGFFFALMSTTGLIPNLVPLLTDDGFTPARAAQIAGLLAVAIVLGRLVIGFLLDRIWAPALAAISFGIPSIACLLLGHAGGSPVLTTIAVVIIGFAAGAEFDLLPYIVRRYFGMRHFGTIYGLIYALFVTATAISPPIFGYVHDKTGSYVVMLNAAAVFFLLAGLCLLTLGRYPRDT
jgi:predicted MFS family arabinose efflux permease